MRALDGRPLGLALALSLLGACTTVHSAAPVGDTPVAVEAEAWHGTWAHPEGALVVEALDPPGNRLRVSWIDGTEIRSLEVHLLEASGHMFASFADPDRPELYLWMRIDKNADQALAWRPAAEKIAALVKEGELPGTVDDDGNVVLRELSPAQLALLTSEARGVLFEWEDPLVLTRVAR